MKEHDVAVTSSQKFKIAMMIITLLLILLSAFIVYRQYFAYEIYCMVPAELDQELYLEARSDNIMELTAAGVDFKFDYDHDRNIYFYIRKKDLPRVQQCLSLIDAISQRLYEDLSNKQLS